MTKNMYALYKLIYVVAIICLVLSGCGKKTETSLPPTDTVIPPTSTQLPSPAPTFTPLPPTSTPVPLAASVDGEGITMAEYQAELKRYQAAQQALSGTPSGTQNTSGTNLATDGEKRVLDDLIDQVLLAQAAAKAGFVVDDSTLQARIDQLATQLGSAVALTDWMSAHGYSEQEFRQALRRGVAAAWMRDQIIASVPEVIEQAHARQILLYNSDQANQVLDQLRAGTDFVNLAFQYDPVTGGDLGWFPRGYLTESALEEAVFKLKPGEHTGVIQTQLGFHILLLIELDPQHPLDPTARLVLQTNALQDWLETQRKQSDIQVFLP
jgi:peptidyl-prolyl cis-trans isomerase C